MSTYPTIILTGLLYPRANLVYVTSTTGGVHAPGSWHAKGCAVDFGSGVENAAEIKAAHTTRWKEMDLMAAWWYKRSTHLTELIHTKNLPTGYGGGWYVKNGKHVSRFFYGATTNSAHKNHIHVAVATQVEATKMFTEVYQWVLNDLHYQTVVDGVNGPHTKVSVKSFQRDHGLTVDGVVSTQTIKAMRKAEGWGAL